MVYDKGRLDLTKQFVVVLEETETDVKYGINLPNDYVGDQAFEWDSDGSKRKRWEAYVQELERQGIRGQLTYHEITLVKIPALDHSSKVGDFPLSNYKMVFLNLE